MADTLTYPPREPLAPAMRPEDITDLVAWAHRLTGITIDERKAEFLTARLGRRLIAAGAPDYASYRRLLQRDAAEQTAFAEALTTHTTSFFRERAQFDWLLRDGFPEIVKSLDRPRDIVVWSAACSTGQEGWTALMVAQQAQAAGLWGMKARLIGTDLSRQVLKVAAQAVYPDRQIAEIPMDLRRSVLLTSRKGELRHRIVPELRRAATWRQANLASGAGLDGITADVVFLRNVLIYFDEDVRERVLDNVVRRLRPGGFLLVGHTEAAHAKRDCLSLVRPSIFRKDRS